MIFITGPMFGGKRAVAKELLGCDDAALEKRCACDVHELARERGDLETLADELARYDAVTAAEVGGGVVPLDPEERAARERAGRLACLLAERAETVVRVFCGIPRVVKGRRMDVYLYRHGATEWNAQARYQGRASDIPLSGEGERALRRAPFTAAEVFVSPLLRARRTAELLFPEARQTVVEAFAEMDFGDFTGRSYREMEHDAAYRAWVDGGCAGRCPGGEDRAEFSARVCGAFEPLLERAAAEGGDKLVIVAHSGTLRAVMERYALPRRGYFDWNAPCGGGFTLAWDEARWAHEKRLLSGVAPC